MLIFVIVCIAPIFRNHIQGSDGRLYKQLVKGGDDMRQDAVMEQVFQNVNCTLLKDSETSKRRVTIRTYKIVPTTPQTGVLEWVENTAPYGNLLTEKDVGLHSRYFPNDWTHPQCREHMDNKASKSKNPATSFDADKEIRFAEILGWFCFLNPSLFLLIG